jgi:hypothetical protein
MISDKDILSSDSHWTELRHQVCAVIARNFPAHRVEVDGDGILISNGRPLVLVEQIDQGKYRTKTNGAGNPGDPRKIVAGGVSVSADDLLPQIVKDIALIDARNRKPSS